MAVELGFPLAPYSLYSLTCGLMKWPFFALVAVAASGSFSGCSCIQEIGGAYFPAWLLSILIGWVLAMIVRIVFVRIGLDGWIRPRSIGYPALNVFFTLLIYLIFFTN